MLTDCQGLTYTEPFDDTVIASLRIEVEVKKYIMQHCQRASCNTW